MEINGIRSLASSSWGDTRPRVALDLTLPQLQLTVTLALIRALLEIGR